MCENHAVLHGLGAARRSEADRPDQADQADEGKMVHDRQFGPWVLCGRGQDVGSYANRLSQNRLGRVPVLLGNRNCLEIENDYNIRVWGKVACLNGS